MAMTDCNNIIYKTPDNAECFFGFHDKCPWSPDNRHVLFLRLPLGVREMAETADSAEVCVLDTESDEVRVAGTTTTWNFQQGARLQWLPGQEKTLCYNALKGDRFVAVLHDVATGSERELDGGIYDISHDGSFAITPDFGVLANYWAAYGYRALAERVMPDPDNSGLWLTDIATGERKLLVSTTMAAKVTKRPEEDANIHTDKQFLTHASISPSGKKLCFLHRYFSEDGALYTRMIVYEFATGKMCLLAEEKVSHYDWFDDENILVWARFSGSGLAKARQNGLFRNPLIYPLIALARKVTGRWKKRLLSESYYVVKTDGSTHTRYGWPHLDSDGHPMIARTHDWIVTDTYPVGGVYPLILFNRKTGERVDAAVLNYNVRSADTDVKCDLHPRFDRTERRVAVDSCENGVRQLCIVDIQKIVGA